MCVQHTYLESSEYRPIKIERASQLVDIQRVVTLLRREREIEYYNEIDHNRL